MTSGSMFVADFHLVNETFTCLLRGADHEWHP